MRYKTPLMLILVVWAAHGAVAADKPQPDWGIQVCPSYSLRSSTSPNGSWAVFGTLKPSLGVWLVNNRTHQRRFLLDCPDTVSVGWAPDGKHFFVNDSWASDETYAFVYDPASLKRIDLSNLLVAAVPNFKSFLDDSHHYVSVERWVNSEELLVDFRGHFDHYPASTWDQWYQVSLSGTVHSASRPKRAARRLPAHRGSDGR